MTTCDERPRRISRGSATALAALAASLLIVPAARAQTEDQAAARAMFEEGRALMKAGQYAAACPKLEAARKLYTSAGILLNLADCHEKIGRTASAWAEFGEAATVATRTNRGEDAEEARRRKAALEASLARIVIRVALPTPGLVVKRDGAILADATWGASLPVDPGAHTVNAEAPGFQPWSTSVTIATPGQTATVDVPQLTPSPVAAAPAKTDTSTAPPGGGTLVTTGAESRPSRVLPWTLIGGGAALAVGGGVLMLVGSGRAADARENNDPAAWDASRTPWTIGLVGAIVGVASGATGAVLLAREKKEPASPAMQAFTWVTAGAGGVALTGKW
jgi:hypothetical protein